MEIPTNDYALKKSQTYEEKDSNLEDRISQLPDDLLNFVLSFLSIKEAAITSVLSKRWKDIWSYFTGSFNFDPAIIECENVHFELESLYAERLRYIGWVNRVLALHKGSRIAEFRVCFDLNNLSKCYIDKWIEIALRNNVEVLELDLSPTLYTSCFYNFPHECLTLVMKSPPYLSWTKFLNSFCLKFVNVTGESLEYLISNCPLLERLTVECSESLANLQIVGSSIKLKYLNISQCFSLHHLEICAPNLMSFEYEGNATALQIVSAPRLHDLSIRDELYHPSAFCANFSQYLSQLKTLELHISILVNDLVLSQIPELSNLRHLKLKVGTRLERSLLCLTSLIEASPLLQKLTLELEVVGGHDRLMVSTVSRSYRNKHLKLVGISGFIGCAIDTEFAIYLLERATKLEKIVLHLRLSMPYQVELPYGNNVDKMKKIMCLLLHKLPPGAKLFVR